MDKVRLHVGSDRKYYRFRLLFVLFEKKKQQIGLAYAGYPTCEDERRKISLFVVIVQLARGKKVFLGHEVVS